MVATEPARFQRSELCEARLTPPQALHVAAEATMAAAPLQSALERAAAEREANLFGKTLLASFRCNLRGTA